MQNRVDSCLHFAVRVDIQNRMAASRRQLAVLRSLRTRKGRQETGLFLVEGVRLCAELLAAKAPVEFVLIAEGLPKSREHSAPVHKSYQQPPASSGARAGGLRGPEQAPAGVTAKQGEGRRREPATTGRCDQPCGAPQRRSPYGSAPGRMRDNTSPNLRTGALGELAARFASSAGAQVLAAPPRDFERISDTVRSQGILAVARWNDVAADALRFGDRPTVLALDAVSDPGNVGTVIRTAAWFGASAVLLGEGCADLLNPKTVRATMGGIFQLPVCRNINLKEELGRLKQLGFRVTAAAMDGEADWRGWAENPRSALVLGNEARGVSEDICRLADQRVTIPRRGAGESLNVAVSAGILLSVL